MKCMYSSGLSMLIDVGSTPTEQQFYDVGSVITGDRTTLWIATLIDAGAIS